MTKLISLKFIKIFQQNTTLNKKLKKNNHKTNIKKQKKFKTQKTQHTKA